MPHTYTQYAKFVAMRDEVTSLLEQAAELSLTNGSSSDQVHTALGVVQNVNRNYPAATRALTSVVRHNPDSYMNWNKLGATLANSGNSEGALLCYHQNIFINISLGLFSKS